MAAGSPNPDASLPRRPWRRRVFLLTFLVGGGLAVYRWLRQQADLSRIDPTPLPRPKRNAPYIQSKDKVIDKMIELAQVQEKDLVYDLGCGDGRIVISAAVQRGCRGVGIDIDPKRIAESEANAKEQAVDQRVSFRQADIFKVDLKEADVVLMYLLPWMVQDLVPQFEQCRPGTRIVSEDWKLDNYEADQRVTVDLPDNQSHYLFLYTTPLRRIAAK